MAEQPVVQVLLTTEVKSLQVKLNPHQKQLPDTNSKIPKKKSITQALKTPQENKFSIFWSKIWRIRNKT